MTVTGSENAESETNTQPASPAPVSPPAPSAPEEDKMAAKTTETDPSPEEGTTPAPAEDKKADVAPDDEIQADEEGQPKQNKEGDVDEEQPKQKKVVKKREINPKFKDVRETGKWGEISKSETLVVGIAIALVLLLAIILIPLMIVRSNQDKPIRGGPAPTAPPTAMSADMELSAIRAAIEGNEMTIGLIDALPSVADDYEALQMDTAATPQERAMSWMLFGDGNNDPEDLAIRWSLASFYYTFGGENWSNSTNWLQDAHYCDWFGVLCNRAKKLEQLVLEENNLIGTIPSEVALWTDLQVFWLSNNEVSGTIPGEVLGSLPKMSIIYLDHNKLSGTVPESLRNNEVLRKCY